MQFFPLYPFRFSYRYEYTTGDRQPAIIMTTSAAPNLPKGMNAQQRHTSPMTTYTLPAKRCVAVQFASLVYVHGTRMPIHLFIVHLGM